MRFLINPVKSVRFRGKPVSSKKWKESGYSRNKPTAKQLAARKKFTAMVKARAAAKRTTTRADGDETMAGRKRKAAHRRTTARRVKRARRSRSIVYRTNPRKRSHARKRVRRYRRNPSVGGLSIMSTGKRIAIGVAGILGGVAVGNFFTANIAPKLFAPSATDTPKSTAVRNALVVGAAAIGVAKFGRKFVGGDLATTIAIGMLVVPIKNLVAAMAPSAGGMLSLSGTSTAMPPFPGGMPRKRISAPVGSYPRPAMGAYPALGAYPTYAGQMQPV